MVTMGGRQQAVCSWSHWALKPYVDQGSCQDGVAHMFWISLIVHFHILIALYFDMRIKFSFACRNIIAWLTTLERMKPTSSSTMSHGRWLRTPSSLPTAYLLPPAIRRWIYFYFAHRCWSYLFFTLTCKCNFFLHASVEAEGKAHPGPQDLSDQGGAPSGGSIDWLRIRRPGTDSVATGRPTSSEPYRSGTRRTGRPSPWCTTTACVNTSARRREWQERLVLLILNFCVTNLFNYVLQKKRTGVDPHYFDV
jgi:hypothetical protein